MWIYDFISLKEIIRNEIVGSNIYLCLTFLETAKWYCKVGRYSIISPNFKFTECQITIIVLWTSLDFLSQVDFKPLPILIIFYYALSFSTLYIVHCSVAKSHPTATPWTVACQASLSFTIFCPSLSLLKFMSIESVMLSEHLIVCCPLLLLPSVFLSIRVFSNELALCIRWTKYWSFSISPSNEYSVIISFRIDWFDLKCSLRDSQESSPASIQKHQPAQVGCNRQVLWAGALGKPRDIGWGERREGGLGWGTHVNPWLIHVNVRQKPLQYCKVISLQLIKINEKKKSINSSAPSLLYSPSLTFIHNSGKTIVWLYGPLLANWYLCFFNTLSSLSWLFFQGASVF